MARILVVDDSPVDRLLVGELLNADADFEIDQAVHGGEALEKISQAEPDLVVTDLIMPEMDGLELVSAVRSEHPLVPVILMTSQGTEETAVTALQRGAASYVPKHILASDLLETVHRVLAVSSRQRAHTRLMDCLVQTECTFLLENDGALFAPLVSYLQEVVMQLGLCGDADRTRVGVALEEALTNALYHGNLEIGSELRGEDDEAYHALVRQRRCEAPYCHRRVHVQASMSPGKAAFVVRDEGSGFDFAALPDPTDPANLERASGRGILLMRTFMDDVAYNELGNAVTLVKCREGQLPSNERKD